jgi:hypothetical protein
VPVAGLLIGMVLTVPAADLQGLPDADVLRQAEAAFHEGVRLRDRTGEARPAFARAAECYEVLRQQGADNPALLRNEGNAYLLAGDLPHAILAYRRGLDRSPNDRALRAGLEAARAQVAYPRPGNFGRPRVGPLPPWLPRPTPAWFLTAALLLYAGGCAALTRWWMLREGRLLAAGCVLLAAAVLPAAAFGLQERARSQEAQHPLVVIAADGVLLRRGNGLSYPPRYDTPINRGVEARLLGERGAWLHVELAGGERGWVAAKYALVDRAP